MLQPLPRFLLPTAEMRGNLHLENRQRVPVV
jgi:hypothetical protein